MDFSYFDNLLDQEIKPEAVEETGEGFRNVWVFAESSEGELNFATLEAMGQARNLADQIGVYVYAILLEKDAALPDPLIQYGADKVLILGDSDHPESFTEYQPEIYVQALADLVLQLHPEIFLLSATSLGNDLAPRLAQRLNTGLISHCIKLEIDMAERLILGTSPALGGEVYHTFSCPTARPQIATLEPGTFYRLERRAGRQGEVQKVHMDLNGIARKLIWTDLKTPPVQNKIPLGKARIVISAGRGMGSEAGFKMVEQLASALGGLVAGSRGAFEEGWIREDQMVGVGGEMVSPALYVACGLSGDIHHYFGIQEAKFIVAINPDEQAPIMKLANLAVVGDACAVIPEIMKALSS